VLNHVKQMRGSVLHGAAARFAPPVIDLAIRRPKRWKMLPGRHRHLMQRADRAFGEQRAHVQRGRMIPQNVADLQHFARREPTQSLGVVQTRAKRLFDQKSRRGRK
jgi:hypothetical protein